jgi:heat shock protein HtpX
MQRRALGRDLGLSCRMAIALVLLLASYLAIVALVVFLIAYRPSYWWLWGLAGVALAVALGNRYRGGGEAILRSLGAETMPLEADHDLHSVVARLAGLAGVPTPRIAVAATSAPNALAVGLSRTGSTVVVTQGLLDLLSPKELEAVLAHEIAHLANRDAAVMTAVSAPRVLGEVMIGEAGSNLGTLWLVVWPLGLIPLGLGTGLTLTMSRYREFSADRGSAILTGAPEQLMSALLKLAGHAGEIPHEDLRAANAFCIVSTEAHALSVFSDHPTLKKRLAALEEIAREMGKRVS